MTVVRRDERRNRLRAWRRVRALGAFAMLAVSAGGGCGQSIIRRPPPSLTGQEPATALRLSDEAIPGRGLAWQEPGVKSGERLTSLTASEKFTAMRSMPKDFVAFGRPSTASDPVISSSTTAWNGWKLPGRGHDPSAPRMPGMWAGLDALVVASRETGIALPSRTASPADDRVLAAAAPPTPEPAPVEAPAAPVNIPLPKTLAKAKPAEASATVPEPARTPETPPVLADRIPTAPVANAEAAAPPSEPVAAIPAEEAVAKQDPAPEPGRPDPIPPARPDVVVSTGSKPEDPSPDPVAPAAPPEPTPGDPLEEASRSTKIALPRKLHPPADPAPVVLTGPPDDTPTSPGVENPETVPEVEPQPDKAAPAAELETVVVDVKDKSDVEAMPLPSLPTGDGDAPAEMPTVATAQSTPSPSEPTAPAESPSAESPAVALPTAVAEEGVATSPAPVEPTPSPTTASAEIPMPLPVESRPTAETTASAGRSSPRLRW